MEYFIRDEMSLGAQKLKAYLVAGRAVDVNPAD
jgi:hypothetical protein